MTSRLSVHSVTFLGASVDEYDAHWQAMGLNRLSLVDTQLQDPALAPLIERRGYVVDSVFHLFASAEGLDRVVDAAAAVGARCVYMLTGGRGELTWEQAAEWFATAIGPCRTRAQQAGVTLAIENASALYADIHIAHTLRDTIALAEAADLGICIDLFHCWAEADLASLVRRALPRIQSIQLSDYVLGDRALPARAVPGDGAIPIANFVRTALELGYPHGFDLELIGPRIDHEGPAHAAQRACAAVESMIEENG
jgi:sugar phosphate isomerase/epimerase